MPRQTLPVRLQLTALAWRSTWICIGDSMFIDRRRNVHICVRLELPERVSCLARLFKTRSPANSYTYTSEHATVHPRTSFWTPIHRRPVHRRNQPPPAPRPRLIQHNPHARGRKPSTPLPHRRHRQSVGIQQHRSPLTRQTPPPPHPSE